MRIRSDPQDFSCDQRMEEGLSLPTRHIYLVFSCNKGDYLARHQVIPCTLVSPVWSHRRSITMACGLVLYIAYSTGARVCLHRTSVTVVVHTALHLRELSTGSRTLVGSESVTGQ